MRAEMMNRNKSIKVAEGVDICSYIEEEDDTINEEEKYKQQARPKSTDVAKIVDQINTTNKIDPSMIMEINRVNLDY